MNKCVGDQLAKDDKKGINTKSSTLRPERTSKSKRKSSKTFDGEMWTIWCQLENNKKKYKLSLSHEQTITCHEQTFMAPLSLQNVYRLPANPVEMAAESPSWNSWASLRLYPSDSKQRRQFLNGCTMNSAAHEAPHFLGIMQPTALFISIRNSRGGLPQCGGCIAFSKNICLDWMTRWVLTYSSCEFIYSRQAHAVTTSWSVNRSGIFKSSTRIFFSTQPQGRI